MISCLATTFKKSNTLILNCALFAFCILALIYELSNNVSRSRRLTRTDDKGEFIVKWSLSLGGKESILKSRFLKAGLEQSIKDYMNNDFKCNSQNGKEIPSLHSVEIMDFDVSTLSKNRRIEGNGKCKGDPERCKKGINSMNGESNTVEEEDDDFFEFTDNDEDKRKAPVLSSKMSSTSTKNDFCELFRESTIFDSFRNIVVTTSYFNYRVDVQDVHDLMGSLTLNFNAAFQPAKGAGLMEIDSVGLQTKELLPVNTSCTESQCITQNAVVTNIMNHFGVPFDGSKHECQFEGINCNSDDLVTYIWLSKYYGTCIFCSYKIIQPDFITNFSFLYKGERNLSEKSIPESLSFLPSLKGLFLGELVFNLVVCLEMKNL